MPAISPEHTLLLTQLEAIAKLSDEDRQVLASLPLRIKDVGENRDIVREGDHPTESCMVVSGMVARYKMVAGGRRQILSFHFPGDLPDLQSLNLDVMDHSIVALVRTRVAFIPHDAIRRAIASHAGVREAIVRHALVDGSMFREWIANVGRRTARERVAHIICECFVRLRALGIVTANSFELPLTQTEIGDAAGLSNVHVNRTMRHLQRAGLIATSGQTHSILDWQQLQEAADFNPAYLHLRNPVTI